MVGPKGNTVPSAGSWEHRIGGNDGDNDADAAAFPPSRDRYHLYAAWFCPFAHRVLLTRELKKLQPFLPVTIVKPYPKEGGGWRLPATKDEYPGSDPDPLYGARFLHEVYFRSPPGYDKYEGKYSVPVLWDKQGSGGRGRIVNNESEQIVRNLQTAYNGFLPEGSPERALDLYPPALRSEIDAVNAWLMPDLCSGVYKAGFAPDQAGYEQQCVVVFAALGRLSKLLAAHNGPYILGEGGRRMTELDLKAYATLVRFDPVYVQHFKLNLHMLRQDPVLNRYLKNLYWKTPGFRETTDFRHIKENYTKSHADINPKAITPLGPDPPVEAWTAEDEEWRQGWLKEAS